MRPWLLLVAAVIAAVPRSADACSCYRRHEVASIRGFRNAVDETAVVFEGIVTARRDDPRRTQLTVRRVWRGAVGPEVEVREPRICGYGFEHGGSYIVFADRGEDGTLWTSACSYTMLTSEAHNLDEALGDGRMPSGAGIQGCTLAADPSLPALLLLLIIRRRRHSP